MASIRQVNGKWRAEIRRKDFPPQVRSFPTERECRKWARDTEIAMDEGHFEPFDKEGHKVTVEGLIDRFVEHREARHRTRLKNRKVGESEGRPQSAVGRSTMGALANLKRLLGDRNAARLTSDAVVSFARERAAEGAGPVTVALDVSTLGTVFKTARNVLHIPVTNPVPDARARLNDAELVGKSGERDRRPTAVELQRIKAWFAAKDRQRIPMSDIIDFAVATAMRASEITSIRWDDLDETNCTILVRDRKDPKKKIGNNQVVPLLPDAMTVIKRQPRLEGQPHIFPFNARSFSSIFPRACTALKIADLRFHDLRHEGISRLFDMGMQTAQVALISGHKDWKQLARYTQVKPAAVLAQFRHLQEVLAKQQEAA
ncbi:site-specific integrase [Paraburkholderia sp. BR14263]|uniref:site-specific integrase n=1 Tax=unclassified Paraburkholderia TaxID=2615204 RepID=UPI0034CDFF34